MQIFAQIAMKKGKELDIERQVSGVVKEVEALNWETFVMSMAHISDQITFDESYKAENFRVIHSRNRFVDYLISPL